MSATHMLILLLLFWHFHENTGQQVVSRRVLEPPQNGICQEATWDDGEVLPICCHGYEKENGECKPKCRECWHGECIGPDQCSCSVNFGDRFLSPNKGEQCDQTCPPGHFGRNCELNCDHILDVKSNKNYTDCSCKSAKMTSDCREICKCRNLCHPGWIGKNCSQPCPENTFGRLCAQNCTCLPDNTQTCNHESGFCTCEDRFHGLNCEFFCEPTKNILICPSHSRHDCRCEPTLEHKYETLASTVDHLAKSVDQSTDADEKIVRMKKILLSLEKIDEGMKRLRNEKDWYSFATHSVVLLLLFSLLSVLIYRTVTSFRLNGSASRSVRYSRRSGEAFNNSIYSETLLAGSSDRTLPRPATAGQPKGDFKISNPFRSSKFLNRLSNFNLTENLFGQRKSPDNALNDVDRRSINEPELKGSEICSTINIMNNLNDQKTESEETVRMTG